VKKRFNSSMISLWLAEGLLLFITMANYRLDFFNHMTNL